MKIKNSWSTAADKNYKTTFEHFGWPYCIYHFQFWVWNWSWHHQKLASTNFRWIQTVFYDFFRHLGFQNFWILVKQDLYRPLVLIFKYCWCSFLFTVFISLNLVFLVQFYTFTCAIILYRFLQWSSVTRAILDFYRKNFFAQFLFFCKFSLDQFYSISHVQFINIVYHNVYPWHVLFFKFLLSIILLKQCLHSFYFLVNLII